LNYLIESQGKNHSLFLGSNTKVQDSGFLRVILMNITYKL